MSQENALSFYNQGVLAAQRGDIKVALQCYDEAIRLDSTMIEALENRGALRSAVGDVNGAFEDYELGMKLDPKRDSLYYNRAQLKAKIGDAEGAIPDYSTALQLRPNNEETICNRGIAYRLMGESSKALADLELAVQLAPQDWIAYFHLGSIRQNIGQLRDAINDLTVCLQLQPKFVQALIQRALTFSLIGNVTDAKRDFEQVILINPQDISIEEIKTQIWKLETRKDDPLVGDAVSTLMRFAYEQCGNRQKNAGFMTMPVEDVRWTITVKPMYLMTAKGYERTVAGATLDLCSSPQVIIRVSTVKGDWIGRNQFEITFLVRAPNPSLPVPGYVEMFTDRVDATCNALRVQLERYLTDKRLLKRGNQLVFDSDPIKINMRQVWIFQADQPAQQE
jgi:tetratricopeptide (TPR) repeat protein